MAREAKSKRQRGSPPHLAGSRLQCNRAAPESVAAVTEKAGGVTPSMAQFLEIKAADPDCLLFYRMGDFYPLFFEDAVAAAQALGIVLTKRGQPFGDDIPMCGVPIHRADEYLQRLIKQGFRVGGVREQLGRRIRPTKSAGQGGRASRRGAAGHRHDPPRTACSTPRRALSDRPLHGAEEAARVDRRSHWRRSTSRPASSRWARCR